MFRVENQLDSVGKTGIVRRASRVAALVDCQCDGPVRHPPLRQPNGPCCAGTIVTTSRRKISFTGGLVLGGLVVQTTGLIPVRPARRPLGCPTCF